ncbi:MAG: thiamine pyrophosphate-dependent dehydrogenase E1 component subunit alpha [Gammaproteobacteria bacterium]|nr:thiamine pyrophosphate-dependent dehydrogenase E1 component subunit alpha [Gammaproteobacteria bacterium]
MNRNQLIEGYIKMLRIRRVEERLVKEYLDKNIRSFVHFYIGQEAIAVGVCMNLTDNDYAFGTHRCHGHYLAKGGSLKRMIAELYGKATGCSKGRGGSMHLVDRKVGYMGSISILASVAPIATGAAFAQKYKGTDNITVVFVGDGAADEGGFYESINLAALMRAPIIFVLEDNLYAGMSSIEARHPESFKMGDIVTGLGGILVYVNGKDLQHVDACMKHGLRRLKETERPIVLQCATYRHMAHSAPIFDDKLGYRKLDTYDTRLEACPIKNLKEKLLDEGLITEEALCGFEKKIANEIDEAIRFAEESPMPKPEDLTKGVYHD